MDIYEDLVLIKPEVIPDRTKGGIFIPEQAKPLPKKGTVVSIGNAVDTVKEGDVVVFQSHFATDIPVNGENLLIIKEDNILYVI